MGAKMRARQRERLRHAAAVATRASVRHAVHNSLQDIRKGASEAVAAARLRANEVAVVTDSLRSHKGQVQRAKQHEKSLLKSLRPAIAKAKADTDSTMGKARLMTVRAGLQSLKEADETVNEDDKLVAKAAKRRDGYVRAAKAAMAAAAKALHRVDDSATHGRSHKGAEKHADEEAMKKAKAKLRKFFDHGDQKALKDLTAQRKAKPVVDAAKKLVSTTIKATKIAQAVMGLPDSQPLQGIPPPGSHGKPVPPQSPAAKHAAAVAAAKAAAAVEAKVAAARAAHASPSKIAALEAAAKAAAAESKLAAAVAAGASQSELAADKAAAAAAAAEAKLWAAIAANASPAELAALKAAAARAAAKAKAAAAAAVVASPAGAATAAADKAVAEAYGGSTRGRGASDMQHVVHSGHGESQLSKDTKELAKDVPTPQNEQRRAEAEKRVADFVKHHPQVAFDETAMDEMSIEDVLLERFHS